MSASLEICLILLITSKNTIRKAVSFAEEELGIQLSNFRVKQALLLSKKVDEYLG